MLHNHMTSSVRFATAPEQAWTCGFHDRGMPHSIATGSPQVTVTAVREVNVRLADDRLEVDFRITDSVTGAL